MLMAFLRALFSASYWKYIFFTKETGKLFGTVAGAWLTVVKILEINQASFLTNAIQHPIQYWLLIVALPILLTTFVFRRPFLTICEKLNNRDIEIQIQIADIFNLPGQIVISTNTTFDTDINNNIISLNSLQGQFTKKFYNNVSHLDQDIINSLIQQGVLGESIQKNLGKNIKYPIGTVVKLFVKERVFYLVTVADINNHGMTSSNIENIKGALASLWAFISSRGELGTVCISILGTGHSRLPERREEVAKEIIRSFIAACASTRFCEKLVIVIHPKDYQSHIINLYELGEYLKYICKYTEFRSPNGTGVGTGIGLAEAT